MHALSRCAVAASGCRGLSARRCPMSVSELHLVSRPSASVLRTAEASRDAGGWLSEMEMEVAGEFLAERDAPGRARRLVAVALRLRGHDRALVDHATLVLSELATNAVLHAGSPFAVKVRLDHATLRIAVRDASPLSELRGGGLVPRAGHGLGLIEALATRWGVEGGSDGKVVWAELRV